MTPLESWITIGLIGLAGYLAARFLFPSSEDGAAQTLNESVRRTSKVEELVRLARVLFGGTSDGWRVAIIRWADQGRDLEMLDGWMRSMSRQRLDVTPDDLG